MKRATLADLPALLDMGRRQVETTLGEFDADGCAEYFANLIENGIILIAERAMIGGVIYDTPYLRDRRVAVCLFWWSERAGSGVRLLRGFRAWGRANGANAISVSPLAGGEQARAVLERMGFTPHETAYVRAI